MQSYDRAFAFLGKIVPRFELRLIMFLLLESVPALLAPGVRSPPIQDGVVLQISPVLQVSLSRFGILIDDHEFELRLIHFPRVEGCRPRNNNTTYHSSRPKQSEGHDINN